MQNFRNEPTLKHYYDKTYEFKLDVSDSVDEEEDRDETTISKNENVTSFLPDERNQNEDLRLRVPEGNTINWSPNKSKYNKYVKKKRYYNSENKKKNNMDQQDKLDLPVVS